jgi:hypothetical protein
MVKAPAWLPGLNNVNNLRYYGVFVRVSQPCESSWRDRGDSVPA